MSQKFTKGSRIGTSHLWSDAVGKTKEWTPESRWPKGGPPRGGPANRPEPQKKVKPTPLKTEDGQLIRDLETYIAMKKQQIEKEQDAKKKAILEHKKQTAEAFQRRFSVMTKISEVSDTEKDKAIDKEENKLIEEFGD